MNILAFMPVFNEVDILPWTIAHMREQGVEIHALDGWSTDGSYELLRDAGNDVTVERFPLVGPNGVQECREILKRIEVLAYRSQHLADWGYLTDADEWRRSPRANETLVDAIARVDAEGWNAVDHVEFAFYCTDDRWVGVDPESYFRHYESAADRCGPPQQKLWKNVGRVELLNGGHVIKFPGIRMCPEKFVLKHYAYRTPAQALSKIKTRLGRRCHEEHRMGWGTHYDAFGTDFSFLWDINSLKEWPDVRTPLP
jgi:Glycosyl transferase family 2